MALSDLRIKQAKPKDKRYTLADGRGLLLEIRPNGQKYWVVRAWLNGKEKRRYIGKYPEIPLKEARIKAVITRNEIFNPEINSQRNKITLKEVADEWLKKRMSDKKTSYIASINLRLNKYILPKIGGMPLNEITSGVILNLCRKIEEQGILETALRVKQVIGQIFRYAIATDRRDYDPTVALAGALQSRQRKHMAAITKPSEIAILMKNINVYPNAITRCALKFSALIFCRPGEVRHAEWNEVDFNNAEWRVPAKKMKMKREHVVPLAKQTVELLKFLYEITGSQKWIFPTVNMNDRPMSENTVYNALRTMGNITVIKNIYNTI